MTVAALIQRLRSVDWTWKRSTITAAVEAFAGQPIEEVPGRVTYRLPGQITLSVCSEGNEVLFVEATLEAFVNPHALSAVEYEDKVDEFFERYQQVVSEAREVLGAPVFDDGSAATGFPEDQEAEWLALWPIDNGRLMIQQKHEDKELPLRLCVVVAPLVTPS